MPNENIKVNFAHICDLAFLSEGGKANIIGIFKSIFTANLPATHPKFSIITSLSLLGIVGEHKEIVKIIHKSSSEQEFYKKEIIFMANKNNQEFNLIIDVINITFEKSGEYIVQVFFDNEDTLLISIPFEVINTSQHGTN